MKNTDSKFAFSMYKLSADGRIVNSRCHDREMEIVEVTDGRVRIQVGTEVTEAEKGDFLCVPPSMVFRADSIDGPASVRGMIFDMSVISDNMEPFDAEIFYMFYVQSRNKITVFDKNYLIQNRLNIGN